MKIHFICAGNIYRSRLAEAYCVSRSVPGTQILSSGIEAGLNGTAPISPYAAAILARFDLSSHASRHWQRTTADLVESSDVLVFMEPGHLRHCEGWIDRTRQKIEVWEIEDVGPLPPAAIAKKVEQTFDLIRQRTDALLTSLALAR